MHIKLEQFMKLPEMKNAKVLSGGITGKDVIVRGGHVVELPQCWKWIESYEVLFLSGVGLRDPEGELLETVENLAAKRVSALVVEVGPYINSVPVSVVELAEKLDFPVIEIPFSIRINDLIGHLYRQLYNEEYETRSMENFMRDLVHMEYNEEMRQKAIYFGYQPNKAYIGLIIELGSVKKAALKGESTEGTIKNTAYSIVKNQFQNFCRTRMFYIDDGDMFIMMLPLEDTCDAKKKLQKEICALREQISAVYPLVTVGVGMGSAFYRISDFKKSIIEAKRALTAAKNEQSNIGSYDEMGFCRLFYEFQDVEMFESVMVSILGSLMDYDTQNNGQLVDTLEAYLHHDKNIGKAADALFLHRNTMKYRLNKIQEILMSDLTDVNTVFNLLLAYKIKGFLVYSGTTY